MSGKRAFYVSYAWPQEEKDEFIQGLEEECKSHWPQIVLRRDKKEMKIGDSIPDFVQRIATADCVVAVVSEAYLESDWCMGEMLAVKENGGWDGRILVVDRTGSKLLGTDQASKSVEKYWEGKVKEREFDPASRRGRRSNHLAAMWLNTNNILAGLDDIFGYLHSHVRATTETTDAELLDRISEILDPATAFAGTPPDASAMPVSLVEPLPPPVAEEVDFTRLLKARIGESLGAGSGVKIGEAMAGLLKEKGSKGLDPAEYLAEKDEPVEAARLLRRAVKGVLEQEPSAIKVVWKCAERIFGLVLLRMVRPEWVKAHREVWDRDGREPPLHLRLLSDAAVEIVVSRLHHELKDVPMFTLGRGAPLGVGGAKELDRGLRNARQAQGLIDHGVSEDYVRETLKGLWEQLITTVTDEPPPEDIEQHLEVLNEHLGYCQEDGEAPYLTVGADDPSNPMNREKVQRLLHAALPNLRMVFITTQDGGADESRLLMCSEKNRLIPLLVQFLKLVEPKP